MRINLPDAARTDSHTRVCVYVRCRHSIYSFGYHCNHGINQVRGASFTALDIIAIIGSTRCVGREICRKEMRINLHDEARADSHTRDNTLSLRFVSLALANLCYSRADARSPE